MMSFLGIFFRIYRNSDCLSISTFKFPAAFFLHFLGFSSTFFFPPPPPELFLCYCHSFSFFFSRGGVFPLRRSWFFFDVVFLIQRDADDPSLIVGPFFHRPEDWWTSTFSFNFPPHLRRSVFFFQISAAFPSSMSFLFYMFSTNCKAQSVPESCPSLFPLIIFFPLCFSFFHFNQPSPGDGHIVPPVTVARF